MKVELSKVKLPQRALSPKKIPLSTKSITALVISPSFQKGEGGGKNPAA
jgi:hypothetical protein